MKLNRLTLENFKGARSFTIEPNGSDLSIYGNNAAGKTTIVDGWLWLLFGKDSHGKADFEIKTLDKDNEPLHNLEHTVEGVIELESGEEVTLKRTYKEVYTKQRGSLTASFTGHESLFWIDGVLKQLNEYKRFIESICQEELFRTLTDTNYFCSQHWEKARKTLMEMVQDVADSDVEGYKSVAKILGTKSLEDGLKALKADATNVNKEINDLPTRIDEAARSLSEVAPGDHASDLVARRQRLQGFQDKKSKLSSGEESAAIATRLAEIATEMAQIHVAITSQGNPARDAALKQQSNLAEQIGLRDSEVRELTRKLNDQSEDLTQATAKIAAKLAEYGSENEKVFRGAEVCPTCEQALPAERVESTRAAFNHAKSQLLEKIIEEGKALRAKAAATQEKIDELSKELTAKVSERDGLIAAKSSLVFPESVTADPMSNPRYAALATEKATLTEKREQIKTDYLAATAEIDANITKTQALITESERALAAQSSNEKTKTRIEELKAREKELGETYGKVQKEIYTLEQFLIAKLTLQGVRFNSKFRTVKIKLFEVAINGGINPCCIVTVDGVTWNSLNHGKRVNAGLEIIDVLGAHFGFQPCIFIDNAESVTDLMPTVAQQIRLVVSAQDSTLRVVTGAQARPTQKAPVQDPANLFEREPVGVTEPF